MIVKVEFEVNVKEVTVAHYNDLEIAQVHDFVADQLEASAKHYANSMDWVRLS